MICHIQIEFKANTLETSVFVIGVIVGNAHKLLIYVS